MSIRVNTCFLFITIVSALLLFGCSKKSEPARTVSAKTENQPVQRCQVLLADPSGNLQASEHTCLSLKHPDKLHGDAALFFRNDSIPHMNLLPNSSRQKGILTSQNPQELKLMGLYARFEEARDFANRLGLPEKARREAKVVYPLPANPQRRPLARLHYDFEQKVLWLAQLTDSDAAEPVLAPGIAVRAYLLFNLATYFPNLTWRNEEEALQTRCDHVRQALVLAFATYGGAAIADNLGYMDAFLSPRHGSLRKIKPISQENYALTVSEYNTDFDPVPIANNIAHCLWQGRETIGVDSHRIAYDRMIFSLVNDPRFPAWSIGPDLIELLKWIGRKAAPTYLPAICGCMDKAFTGVVDDVVDCQVALGRPVEGDPVE